MKKVRLSELNEAVRSFLNREQLSSNERAAVLKAGWERVRQAQERNKGVSAMVIEREVDQAVKEVRRSIVVG